MQILSRPLRHFVSNVERGYHQPLFVENNTFDINQAAINSSQITVGHAIEVALKPESERHNHWVAVSLFAGNRTAMSDELRRYVDAWLKDTGRLP